MVLIYFSHGIPGIINYTLTAALGDADGFLVGELVGRKLGFLEKVGV